MKPTIERQRQFPYRRRLFAARHRRRSLWVRMARPFLGALLLVGSPAGLAAWVLTSPEFAVREIQVSGGERVSAAWIREVLAPIEGASVFEVIPEEVEHRLRAHPWVSSVSVRKQLPDRLEISLEERQPTALFRRDGELFLVDADGVVFAAMEPGIGARGLLLLSGLSTPEALVDAFDVVRELERLAPSWASALSEVEILETSDLRLHSNALPCPVLVSARGLERQVESLRTQLPRLREHLAGVGALDLRFERYIVVQPVKER